MTLCLHQKCQNFNQVGTIVDQTSDGMPSQYKQHEQCFDLISLAPCPTVILLNAIAKVNFLKLFKFNSSH